MFLKFVEYLLTATNDDFFGDKMVHAVFIVSNYPISRLYTITDNVIEEQDVGVSLIDAAKSSTTLYQIINTIKNDMQCRFATSDGFNLIFLELIVNFDFIELQEIITNLEHH